jgi:hypothetical protein
MVYVTSAAKDVPVATKWRELAWVVEEYLKNRYCVGIAKKLHRHPTYVVGGISSFIEQWYPERTRQGTLDDRMHAARAALKNFAAAGGSSVRPPNGSILLFPSQWDPESRREAEAEHAWLLRCEQISFDEIGRRLGVTPAIAKVTVLEYGRAVAAVAAGAMWRLEPTLRP